MIVSIALCVAAFAVLVSLLRRDRVSLGLPIAYLFGLLLIHVPGAFAHVVGGDVVQNSDLTEIGIRLTAIGAICFVGGVWLAHVRRKKAPPRCAANRQQFWLFCLAGGWVFTYGLSAFGQIPSVGAAVEKGGAVWMLGVLLGLRAAVLRSDVKSQILWLSALAVYPTLMLLLGGFLSYGSAAIILVLSGLAVSIRSERRVIAGIVVVAFLGINAFLNYFQHREEIRSAVWDGAALSERIDVSLDAVRQFEWFDPSNVGQLAALDARLNQNYFVGLAAARITAGDVEYLYGRSLWEGVLALIPRIMWPDKPVLAGSPRIVSEMTGLTLSETTSFGVGNVMEFQINFGVPGVVIGFLLLGWGIGALDRQAALAESRGNLGQTFLFFLPAAALIHPNGSLVELAGGPAAALVAAHGWRWAWNVWSTRNIPHARQRRTSPRHSHASVPVVTQIQQVR